MQSSDKHEQVFLALVRAGLWEQDIWLSQYKFIDFNEVYRIAEEQSVVGLVAAGIEHVKDIKVPQMIALTLAGFSLQLEQRNSAMNDFVAKLIERLRQEDVYALLLKGQGIAQCYERPLWRASGDVDLLLSEKNYNLAKELLLPLACNIEKENEYERHLGFTIDNWIVELHGNLRCGLSRKMEILLDKICDDIFYRGNDRSWWSGNTQVFLPSVDNDIIIVFTHFLKHFFYGGVGLRQVCDWVRLLWTYKDKINLVLLESRLNEMGLIAEWKVFAALAVESLGMPPEAMPFYEKGYGRKAQKVVDSILKMGNFGHNRDYGYLNKYPNIIGKFISLWFHTTDSIKMSSIFPLSSFCVWVWSLLNGIKGAFRW